MSYTPITGWRGVVTVGEDNLKLRFTEENIIINQGLAVADDVHVGQRTAGVYEYRHIVPEGSLSFPLMKSAYQMPGAVIETACKYLLTQAITPFNTNDLTMPSIGETMLIQRGDVDKYIEKPFINNIRISGNAGARIDVSLDIVATYGEYQSVTTPAGFNQIARAVFFNELIWDNALPSTRRKDANTTTVPRSFTFTSTGNLQRDDSYNYENPQALRGYVLGRQDVSCEITVVGAVDAFRGGTTSDDPIISTGFSVGGIYNILNGLWTSRTMNVPGPVEIAVTNLTLTGLGTDNFCVQKGSLLA